MVMFAKQYQDVNSQLTEAMKYTAAETMFRIFYERGACDRARAVLACSDAPPLVRENAEIMLRGALERMEWCARVLLKNGYAEEFAANVLEFVKENRNATD